MGDVDERGKAIVIELDGVLDDVASWLGGADIGPPRVGAVEFIRELRDHGYEVVIVTAREPAAARAWLGQHGFAETHAQRELVPARVTLSARGMRFEGSFSHLVERIEAERGDGGVTA